MAVFQPIEILVRDSQTIQIIFSSQPSLFLTKSNFSIASTFSGVSDLEILKIDVSDFTITITTRPQFADNLYLIHLLDLPTQPFEDNEHIELSTITDARNIYFVGVEDINVVRDHMLENLPPNYDTSDQTLVRDITTTMASEINIASITLEEIKNDNFISIPIVDELYFRGHGPTDRLNNEGVYHISRVAKTITGTNAAGSKTLDPIADPNIPFEVINLRVMQAVETIPNGTSANKFDGFLITTSHHYVTKLISVTLSPGDIFYDPSKFGYALLNNNYDRFARPSPILNSNQILLSPLTNGVFPEPIPGDTLEVIYEYDSVGRRVDKSSVSLFTVLQQINEGIPASVTTFFLEFSNVVNEQGKVLITGGIEFNVSTIDLTKHPAFLREIAFNTDSLPSAPGEYSVNYTTGQVFVFGTQTQIGTGTIPPVATYFYKSIATSNVDYFISDDGYNVSLNPFSQFAMQIFTISFLYEDVLSPDVDYRISSHIEILNERINNRLISDFGVVVNNGPVKDVYQVKNETTGELYTPGLVEGNKIFFTGNTPPHTSTTLGELAQPGVVDDEILNVGMETTTPNGSLRILPIALLKSPVLNSRYDGIGSHFNTSIQLTRTDLFLKEHYFNPFDSVQLNLEKLLVIGDYVIDYKNGNIYLVVSSIQNFDLGHISYGYGAFVPEHRHVLGVSGIGLGTTSTHITQDFDLGIVEDGLIVPKNMNYGYDSFDGQTRVPNSDSIFVAQLQDNFTVYTKYPIKKVYSVFTQNDANIYDTENLTTKNLFDSSVNLFLGTLIDLKTYVVLPVQADVNPNYYNVIIPDSTTVVKSIVTVDTGIQLLDTQLFIIKYKNIITKTVVAGPFVNEATIKLQNIITLINPILDYFVDIAGHRFPILSISGGNELIVDATLTMPIVNVGSQILDHNGILVANYLDIISVTELPSLLYILHYDIFPTGILPGYQVKDYNGNVFLITDVQSGSVVVSVSDPTVIPIIDPVAKIETQSLLVQDSPAPGMTKLMLPKDAPIVIGTNLRIGYVPTSLNDSIVAANAVTGSAGGAGLIIDYSIGQFFLNYTHLDDELLVSYDWGDNQIDWSISDTLSESDPYYVSYEYGASRNGLEINFGPLTNVDFLLNAALSVSRETYRTAVSAAIKAFLKGPTYEALRLLAHAFTQIDPDIQESILNQWIVGRDPLSLQEPVSTGSIEFGNGKYNEGLVISSNNSIQLPGPSSLRLAQGTFSTWFRPNWNGNQADEDVVFTLPTAPINVYYNAHDILPQDAPENPWYLVVGSDSYGTAYVNSDYLEVHNSKNEYTTSSIPSNDGYLVIHGDDGYDGYTISSDLMLHDAFTAFPYARRIGTYIWSRTEPTLCLVNDLNVNFLGYVHELKYVNPIINVINVATAEIDDGYGKYNTGFYLFKRNQYAAEVILEDVHLSIEPPFPHTSPPIFVSTLIGQTTATVVSGDTSTLSVGQQVTIGTAFPTLTNIIGFTPTTIVLRQAALTTQTNVAVGNLDPISDPGTQDGYSETHLQDKVGRRTPGTTEERINGWERQLIVKLKLTPFASGHLMVIGSSDPPLTTETPVIDFLDSILPGTDVFVDGYGNTFEIAKIELPFAYIKKPSASGITLPIGTITAFRKVVGVKLPDQTLISTPVNWSNSTSCSMSKQSGLIILKSNQITVNGSYVSHYSSNSSGISSISFGQTDINIDSIIRVQGVNYSIHSIFEKEDTYIGNTGNNPLNDIVPFKYELSTTGIPAINSDKYFAIFTSKTNAATDEPVDQVFVKMKVPSIWTLDDGEDELDFPAVPVIKFSAITSGDIIDIVDGYGLTYKKIEKNKINFTAVDDVLNVYVPGNSSILFDNGPELRISAGKKHYLLDVETPEGALRLYRSGDGFMIAEIQLNDPSMLNIRSDISSWTAGSIHHVAMSWKIHSPDIQDELHLFIDGDEVPNEVTFGSSMLDGYIGQIYEEEISVVSRVASVDGYIVNDIDGSGVFIPTTNIVQPDTSWINKTIVLEATIPGPNDFLNEPLIVGAIIEVVGGKLLLLSQFGTQIDFALYGPSTPILFGLATSAIAQTTILTRTNFSVFKNGVELMGPNSASPQFRQVGNTQIVEIYNVNSITGQYEENVSILDTITIRTYGLLSERIKDRVYQFGSLLRTEPIVVDINVSGHLISVNVPIAGGAGAFITDLPPPVDPTQVKVTKILLPRIMI